MADWGWWEWQIENGVHESPLTPPIYLNVSRLENRTSDISTSDGSHIIVTKMTVCLVVARLYNSPLEESRQSHSVLATSIGTVLWCSRHTQVKEGPFFVEKVSWFGDAIRPGRLELFVETTADVRKANDPTTLTVMKSFLGLCNVFRRFVAKSLKVATQLNKKLWKDQPTTLFFLTPAEKHAVESLKALLMNPPILALSRASG